MLLLKFKAGLEMKRILNDRMALDGVQNWYSGDQRQVSLMPMILLDRVVLD